MEREALKTETKVIRGVSGQSVVDQVLFDIRRALGIQTDNEITADLSNKRGISVVIKEMDNNHNLIEGAEVTKTILRDFDLNDPDVKQVLEEYLSMRGIAALRKNYQGVTEYNNVFSYIEENFEKRIEERKNPRVEDIECEFSADGQTVTISSGVLSSERLIQSLPLKLLMLNDLLDGNNEEPFPRKLKVEMYGNYVDIDLTVGGLCNTKAKIMENLTNLAVYIQDAINRNIFDTIIGDKKKNTTELMAAQWRMCSKAIEPFFNEIDAQVNDMSDDIIKEPEEYVTRTYQECERDEIKYQALLLKPTIRNDDSFISASPKIQDVLRIYRATVLWKRKFEKEEKEGKEHEDFKFNEKIKCSGFGFKCFTTNKDNRRQDQKYKYTTAWAPIKVEGSAAFFELVQREMRHIFIDDPQNYSREVNGSLDYNVESIKNMMNDAECKPIYMYRKLFNDAIRGADGILNLPEKLEKQEQEARRREEEARRREEEARRREEEAMRQEASKKDFLEVEKQLMEQQGNFERLYTRYNPFFKNHEIEGVIEDSNSQIIDDIYYLLKPYPGQGFYDLVIPRFGFTCEKGCMRVIPNSAIEGENKGSIIYQIDVQREGEENPRTYFIKEIGEQTLLSDVAEDKVYQISGDVRKNILTYINHKLFCSRLLDYKDPSYGGYIEDAQKGTQYYAGIKGALIDGAEIENMCSSETKEGLRKFCKISEEKIPEGHDPMLKAYNRENKRFREFCISTNTHILYDDGYNRALLLPDNTLLLDHFSEPQALESAFRSICQKNDDFQIKQIIAVNSPSFFMPKTETKNKDLQLFKFKDGSNKSFKEITKNGSITAIDFRTFLLGNRDTKEEGQCNFEGINPTSIYSRGDFGWNFHQYKEDNQGVHYASGYYVTLQDAVNDKPSVVYSHEYSNSTTCQLPRDTSTMIANDLIVRNKDQNNEEYYDNYEETKEDENEKNLSEGEQKRLDDYVESSIFSVLSQLEELGPLQYKIVGEGNDKRSVFLSEGSIGSGKQQRKIGITFNYWGDKDNGDIYQTMEISTIINESFVPYRSDIIIQIKENQDIDGNPLTTWRDMEIYYRPAYKSPLEKPRKDVPYYVYKPTPEVSERIMSRLFDSLEDKEISLNNVQREDLILDIYPGLLNENSNFFTSMNLFNIKKNLRVRNLGLLEEKMLMRGYTKTKGMYTTTLEEIRRQEESITRNVDLDSNDDLNNDNMNGVLPNNLLTNYVGSMSNDKLINTTSIPMNTGAESSNDANANTNVINSDVIKTETPIAFQSTTLGGEIPPIPNNPFLSTMPEVPNMDYGLLPQSPIVVIPKSEISKNIENPGATLSNTLQLDKTPSSRSYAVHPIDPNIFSSGEGEGNIENGNSGTDTSSSVAFTINPTASDLFSSGEGEGNIENGNSGTDTPIDLNADDSSDFEFSFGAFSQSIKSNTEDSLNVSVNSDATPDIHGFFESEEFNQIIDCLQNGEPGVLWGTKLSYVYNGKETEFKVVNINSKNPGISSIAGNNEEVVIQKTDDPGKFLVRLGETEYWYNNPAFTERFNDCIDIARRNVNSNRRQIEEKYRELSGNEELKTTEGVIVDKNTQKASLIINFIDEKENTRYIFVYDPSQYKLKYYSINNESGETEPIEVPTSVEFGNEFFQKFFTMVKGNKEEDEDEDISEREIEELKKEETIYIPICNIDDTKYYLLSKGIRIDDKYIIQETTDGYKGQRKQTIFRVCDGVSSSIEDRELFALGDIKDYKKEVSDLISHLQSIVNNSELQLYENGDETGYFIYEKSSTGEIIKRYDITDNSLAIQDSSGRLAGNTIQIIFDNIGGGAENKAECIYQDTSSEPSITRRISTCGEEYKKLTNLYNTIGYMMGQSQHNFQAMEGNEYDTSTLSNTNRSTQDTNPKHGLGASNPRNAFDAIEDDEYDTSSLSSSINRSVSNPKPASTLDAIDDEPESNSDDSNSNLNDSNSNLNDSNSNLNDSNSNLNDSNSNLNDSNKGLAVPLDDKDEGLVIPLDNPDEGVSTSSDTLTHDFNFQNYGNIVNYRGKVLLEGTNLQWDNESMIAKKRLKEISQALSSEESQKGVKWIGAKILQTDANGKPVPFHFSFACEFKGRAFEYKYIPSISRLFCFPLKRDGRGYSTIQGEESSGYMSGATAAEIFIPAYVKARQKFREEDITVKSEDKTLITNRFNGRTKLGESELFFPLGNSVEFTESGKQQTRHNYLYFTETQGRSEPDFYVVQDVVQEDGSHQMYVEKNTFNKDDKKENKIDSKGTFKDPSEKYYEKADEILNELEIFYSKSDKELTITPPESEQEGWIISSGTSKTSFVITNNTIAMITRDGIGGSTQRTISIEDGEIKYTEHNGNTKKESALLSYNKDIIMEKYGEYYNKMLDRCYRIADKGSRPKTITKDDKEILNGLITGYEKANENIRISGKITRQGESFSVQDKDDKDKSYEFNQDSFTIITKKSEQSAQYQTFYLKEDGEIETESYILEKREGEDDYKKKDLKRHSIYVQPESVQNFSNNLSRMCDLYKIMNPVAALGEDTQKALQHIESQPTNLICIEGITTYDLDGPKGRERIILDPNGEAFIYTNFETNKSTIYTLHNDSLEIECSNSGKNEKELTLEEKERINQLFNELYQKSQQQVEEQRRLIQTEMQELLEQFDKNHDKVRVFQDGSEQVTVMEDDGYKFIKKNLNTGEISYQKGDVVKSYKVDDCGVVTCTSRNVADKNNPIKTSQIIVDGINNVMTNQHGAILPGQNGQTMDLAERNRYSENLIGTLRILAQHIDEGYEGISIKRENDAIKIICDEIEFPVTIRGNSISIQSIDNSGEDKPQETTYNIYKDEITIKNDNSSDEIALLDPTSLYDQGSLMEAQWYFNNISRKIRNNFEQNIHDNKEDLLNKQVNSICNSIVNADNIEVDSQSQMVTVQEVDQSRQQVTTITMQRISDEGSDEWRCRKETTIGGTSVESIGIIIDKNNKAKYQNDEDEEEITITQDNQELLKHAQQHVTNRILIKDGIISEGAGFVNVILHNMRNSFEEFKKGEEADKYTLAQDGETISIQDNINHEKFIIDKMQNTINYIYFDNDIGEEICTVIGAPKTAPLSDDNKQIINVINYKSDGRGGWEPAEETQQFLGQYQEYFDELYKDMQGQYEKHMIFDEILKPIVNTSLDNLVIQEGEGGAKQITLKTDERFQIKYTGSSEQDSNIEIILLPQQGETGPAKGMILNSEGHITLVEYNGDEWSNEKQYQIYDKLLYCINDRTKTACSEDECMMARDIMSRLFVKTQQNSAANENQNKEDKRVDEADNIDSDSRSFLPEDINPSTFKPFNPLDYANEESFDFFDTPLIPTNPIPTTQSPQNPYSVFINNPANPAYNPANPADNSRGAPIPGSQFPPYGFGSHVYKPISPKSTDPLAVLPQTPTGPIATGNNRGGGNSNSNRNNAGGTNIPRRQPAYNPTPRREISKPLGPNHTDHADTFTPPVNNPKGQQSTPRDNAPFNFGGGGNYRGSPSPQPPLPPPPAPQPPKFSLSHGSDATQDPSGSNPHERYHRGRYNRQPGGGYSLSQSSSSIFSRIPGTGGNQFDPNNSIPSPRGKGDYSPSPLSPYFSSLFGPGADGSPSNPNKNPFATDPEFSRYRDLLLNWPIRNDSSSPLPQQPLQSPVIPQPPVFSRVLSTTQDPFDQDYSPSSSQSPILPYIPGTGGNQFDPNNSTPNPRGNGVHSPSLSPQAPILPYIPGTTPNPFDQNDNLYDRLLYQLGPGGDDSASSSPRLPFPPPPPNPFGPGATQNSFVSNPYNRYLREAYNRWPAGNYNPSQPLFPGGPGGHNYGYSTEEELEEERFNISPPSNGPLRDLGNGRATSRYKGTFDKVTSTEGLYEAISDLVNKGIITNSITEETSLIFTDMYQRAAELCNFEKTKMLHTFNEFLDKADKNTYAGHEKIKNAVLDFMQTSVEINQGNLLLNRDILLSDQIDNKYKSEFEERVVKLYLEEPKDYNIAKNYHDMQDYICTFMDACGDDRVNKYANKMFTNMEKAFIDGVGKGLAARDDHMTIIDNLVNNLYINDGISPTTKVDMLSRVTPKILKNLSDNLVEKVEWNILSKDVQDTTNDQNHIPHIQAFFSSINDKESAEKAYKNFGNIILTDAVINNSKTVTGIFENFKATDEKAYNKMIDGVISNLDERGNYDRLKTLLVDISQTNPSIGIDLYHKLSQKQSVDNPALTTELSQLLEATGLAERIRNDETLSSNYEIIHNNILTKREGRDIEKILSSIPLSPEKRNTLQQQLKLLSTPEEIFELLNSTIKNNNSLVNGEFDNERIDLLNSSDKDVIRKNFQKKELVNLFTGKASTELDSSRGDFYKRIEKYAENMYIPWWHNRLGSKSKRERARVRKLAQNLKERDQKFTRERDCLQAYGLKHFSRAKEAATYIAQYEFYTKIKENVGGKYTEKQVDFAKQSLKQLAHKHSYSFTAVFKDWKKVGFWNTFLGLINKEDRFYINAKRALERSNKKLAVIYGSNVQPGSFSQNGPCYTVSYDAVPDAENMSFTSKRLKRMLNGGILSPFKYWSRHKYFKNITVSRDAELNAAQKISKQFLEDSSDMRKKGIELLNDGSFFDTNNALANLRVDSKNITDKEMQQVINRAFSKDKSQGNSMQ